MRKNTTTGNKLVIKQDTQIRGRIKKPEDSADTKQRIKDHEKDESPITGEEEERRGERQGGTTIAQVGENRKPRKGEYIAKGTGRGREERKETHSRQSQEHQTPKE